MEQWQRLEKERPSLYMFKIKCTFGIIWEPDVFQTWCSLIIPDLVLQAKNFKLNSAFNRDEIRSLFLISISS